MLHLTDDNPSLNAMTPIEAYLSSEELEKAITEDDGLAAQQHLDAGHPIYYGDEAFPEGFIKKYPDGRKQLVTISEDGKVSVIRDL